MVLLCGVGVWYYCVILPCGTDVWYCLVDCVILLCGIAACEESVCGTICCLVVVWYFCVVLMCGFYCVVQLYGIVVWYCCMTLPCVTDAW